MLLILSPSKTMVNPDEITQGYDVTTPQFQKEAATLNKTLSKYDPSSLATLMKISEKLAVHSARLNAQFMLESSPSVPSIFAYTGEVYRGLNASGFQEPQLKFAQQHLVILSGMYGALKPMDLIKPYRLEIGLGLKVGKYKNLYEFWGSKIAEFLKSQLETHDDKSIVNLASEEYFKVVAKFIPACTVLHIDFYEWHMGKWTIQSVYAKRARGLMCRYAIENKIKKSSDLKKFAEEGYTFNEPLSEKDHWVFTRKNKPVKTV